jgi:preprotein translocase subunit Sec63
MLDMWVLVPKLHSERVNSPRQRSAIVDCRSPADLPRTLISSRRPDRMTGYDLTFSAPIGVTLPFTPRSRR